MKRIKRMVAFVIAAVMTLTMVPATSITAQAKETSSITVTNLKDGDEVGIYPIFTRPGSYTSTATWAKNAWDNLGDWEDVVFCILTKQELEENICARPYPIPKRLPPRHHSVSRG